MGDGMVGRIFKAVAVGAGAAAMLWLPRFWRELAGGAAVPQIAAGRVSPWADDERVRSREAVATGDGDQGAPGER